MKRITTPIKILIIATLLTLVVTTSTTLNDLVITKPLTIDQYKALEDAIAFNSFKLFLLVLVTVSMLSVVANQIYSYLKNTEEEETAASAAIRAQAQATQSSRKQGLGAYGLHSAAIAGVNPFPKDQLEAQLRAVKAQRDSIDKSMEEAARASDISFDKAPTTDPKRKSLAGFYGPIIFELPFSDIKILTSGHKEHRVTVLTLMLMQYQSSPAGTTVYDVYITRIKQELDTLK